MENKYNLIETFFKDEEDYISFLVGLKERCIANDEATCMAQLKKEDGNYIYLLHWLKDGRYVGDYIKPFKASKENIDLFNKGCKIIAERLQIFLQTDDSSKVPNDFPAFGELTFVKE